MESKLSVDQILKLKKLQLLEARRQKQKELPHLYGFKFYQWQREFWESKNNLNFLTAANQIGKSSIAIRKCLHWATAPSMWKKLWPNRMKVEGDIPGQFWYLYPDLKVATVEYHEKWIKEFLPKNSMKNDPVYGWKPIFVRRQISEIRFNTGVTVYFKTYMQSPQSLQSGTVYAIFCDEELPFNLFDELNMRISATDGYFHNVFTATLNQEEWRRTMQPEKGEPAKFPNGAKWQISLYMCKKYEDGSATEWTDERIQNKIDNCGSQLEVDRRIFGKFVSEIGKKYVFEYAKNTLLKKDSKIKKDWYIFGGVDIGSGGKTGHPAAMVFIAVKPDFTEGEVFMGCRMDPGNGFGVTTAGDILKHYLEMEQPYVKRIFKRSYDYHSRDFFTLAERAHVYFEKANKSHNDGEEILNTIFKFEALKIQHYEYDLGNLCRELNSLKKDTDKRVAVDDYADALRYCALGVPWDIEKIKLKFEPKKIIEKNDLDYRREMLFPVAEDIIDDIEFEIAEWNDLYGG